MRDDARSLGRALWTALWMAAVCPAVAQAQAGEAAAANPGTVDAAREHFHRGVAYYADGDLSAALVELQRAYDMQPSYRLLYNLGQVSAESLDYVAAERYFTRYLAEGGDEVGPKRRTEVEAELAQLRSRIASVTVTANQVGAQVFVDDVAAGVTPMKALRVSAGQRRIRVQMPGFDPVTQVANVLGGQPHTVRIELSPIPSPEDAAADVSAPVVVPQSSAYGQAAWWTGLSAGVLALGAAGAAYAAHVSNQDYATALDERTSREQLDRLADRTRTRALFTDVLVGATVAAAVMTTVLLVLDEDEDRPPLASRRLDIAPHGMRLAF